MRASASAERARAVAEVERELAAARAELRAVRDDVRTARRRESERGRAAASARVAGLERERDRRLGAASERASRAAETLRELDVPVVASGPLAAGDVVEASDSGFRGTIAAIDGDEAEVIAASGARLRIAVSRLRPSARRDEPDAEPAITVVAAARGDVSDELDLRGHGAHEAREAVRAFVDEAALAGLPSVRVIHGRGTGAVRTAVRDELRRHGLVERHESDSADGATVVHLSG